MSAPMGGGSVIPPRRGVCPGLSRPVPTGDGLLVRILPIGTIALDAFAALCAAARAYGNGIIEITARGSIQVRGLIAASAPRFADAVAALGLAAEDGVPILCNPLAGLDAAGAARAQARDDGLELRRLECQVGSELVQVLFDNPAHVRAACYRHGAASVWPLP